MSTEDDNITKALIDRNIELAFDFTRALIKNPAFLEGVPFGATLALIPDDDPVVAEANLTGALRAFREGHNVYLRHVDGFPQESPQSGKQGADLAR